MHPIQKYQDNLRTRRFYHERRGRAEYASNAPTTFLKTLLCDVLLGDPIAQWVNLFHQHRQQWNPDEKTPVFIPVIYLKIASIESILGISPDRSLEACHAHLQPAWRAAKSGHQRRTVSSTGLALALRLEDNDGIRKWLEKRQLESVEYGYSDIELQYIASQYIQKQTELASSPELLATMVCENLLRGHSLSTAGITAVLVTADEFDTTPTQLLSSGREAIDQALWADEPYTPPIAHCKPPLWSFRYESDEYSVQARVCVEGRLPGMSALPALLIGILSLAEAITALLVDDETAMKVADIDSLEILQDILADPEISTDIYIEAEEEISVDKDTRKIINQRIQTNEAWLKKLGIIAGPVRFFI